MAQNVKTAMITGASGGIGSAVARLLAQSGYDLALHYCKNRQGAESARDFTQLQGQNALCLQAEISDREQAFRLFERAQAELGFVSALINCAGIAQQKLFCEITDADYNAMLGINLGGVFHCCQAVLPEMIRRKQGKIINISSIWGVHGASCEVHYSAAKAAVIGLTKALAKELAPSNIQVNCIAPGVIETPMHDALPEETKQLLLAQSPAGRLGTGQDVAALARFLASPESDFITGQVIGVDGGFA